MKTPDNNESSLLLDHDLPSTIQTGIFTKYRTENNKDLLLVTDNNQELAAGSIAIIKTDNSGYLPIGITNPEVEITKISKAMLMSGMIKVRQLDSKEEVIIPIAQIQSFQDKEQKHKPDIEKPTEWLVFDTLAEFIIKYFLIETQDKKEVKKISELISKKLGNALGRNRRETCGQFQVTKTTTNALEFKRTIHISGRLDLKQSLKFTATYSTTDGINITKQD